MTDGLLSSMFEDPIAVWEMDPRTADESLMHPEESICIKNAIEKRRKEFAAGRECVRQAASALGEPAFVLLKGADRSPVWPDHLVGSISHTNTWCVAALAKKEDVRSIGVDIESAEPLKEKLWRSICRPEELDELASFEDHVAAMSHAKRIFSAKECAYKAQYLLTKTYLGFQAMRIEFSDAEFVASFAQDAGEFQVGDTLQGRWRVHQGHICSTLVIS